MDGLFLNEVQNLTSDLPNKRVVLAVSGGVDSMVLLEEWMKIPRNLQAKEVVVAHINHQLRTESDDEEQFVKQACERLGCRIKVARWHHQSTFPNGLEAAARAFRYQFFSEVMDEVKADYLVTAHHADDQVETMLMKLVRGSSLEGIAGIKKTRHFSRGKLIRPLLPFSKKIIRKQAEIKEIVFCEDDSNFTIDYQRNRMRWKIVPQLEQENQQMRRHFSEASEQLFDVLAVEKQYLSQIIDEYVTVEVPNKLICINTSKWCQELTASLENRLLEYLFYQQLIKMDKQISRKQLQYLKQFLHMKTAQGDWNLTRNLMLKKRYNELKIEKLSDRITDYQESYLITDYGVTQLSQTELIVVSDEVGLVGGDFTIEIAKTQLPLTVRHRREGDKIQIKNNPIKNQKIRRFMINEKIPLEERDKIWILSDKNEQILAILDYRKASVLFNQSETDKITVSYKKVNRGVDND